MGTKTSVLTLSGCWALLLTASTLITAAAPLSALSVGTSKALSPFTVGSFLFGAAIISAPSHRLFEAVGRAWGFATGCVFGILGGGIGVCAMETQQWALVFVACFLIGASQGMGQFYRFAATELCDKVEDRATAVTFVLAGGIVAAFAGPQAAVHTRTLRPVVSAHFSGCYLIVVVANLINLVLITTIHFKDVRKRRKTVPTYTDDSSLDEPLITDDAASAPQPRTVADIFSQAECVCAVCVASFAHTSMVCLMSPLTIAMNQDGFSFQMTSLTLETHFCAMYAPGMFGTGWIIRKLGPYRTSVLGLLLFATSATTLCIGQSKVNFVLGMALCGVSWNVSFSSGTVLLTTCHQAHEALIVQAVNDFLIFGLAGVGSFASGYVYAAVGWARLVYSVALLEAASAIALGASMYFQRRNVSRILQSDGPSMTTMHELVDDDAARQSHKVSEEDNDWNAPLQGR